jgi:cyclophilin family peptidyl-prolyl cis-trans isomerase
MPKHLWFAFAAAGFFAASIALQAANPQILLKTSKGDITIELFQDKAPISAKNFLSYVDEKFFDGTVFHRIIKGFMIQGGGMTPDLHEKSAKPPIKNEAGNGLMNKRGTLAMARTPEIDSATSQFFINLVDNTFLDHQQGDPDKFGYAVFGKVVSGMDVVDAIAAVPTGSKGMHRDVPREPITILSATRVEGN